MGRANRAGGISEPTATDPIRSVACVRNTIQSAGAVGGNAVDCPALVGGVLLETNRACLAASLVSCARGMVPTAILSDPARGHGPFALAAFLSIGSRPPDWRLARCRRIRR